MMKETSYTQFKDDMATLFAVAFYLAYHAAKWAVIGFIIFVAILIASQADVIIGGLSKEIMTFIAIGLLGLGPMLFGYCAYIGATKMPKTVGRTIYVVVCSLMALAGVFAFTIMLIS